MSWRAIQDTVPASESLAAVSHGAERLYWRILAVTDPHGRLPGSTPKIRAQCLPLVKAKDVEIERWMTELEAAERVLVYVVDGKTYVQVRDFEANQPTEFLRKRGTSRFPEPPKKKSFAGNSGRRAEKAEPLPEKGSLEGEEKEKNKAPNGASPTLSGGEAVQAVYDQWRKARGKTRSNYDTISPARRQKIQARLREYPAEELIRAIDAVALDPWVDRPRHDDLTIIFRSREQVDKFLELADDPSVLTSAERFARRIAEHNAKQDAE